MLMNSPGKAGHASKENNERDYEKGEFSFRGNLVCRVCASVPPQDANTQIGLL